MSIRSQVNKHIRRLEKPFETYNEITVSRSALLNNFDVISSLIPSGNVFPVIKSNGYGHGITEVATILKDRTFPYFAVDSYYECLAIHTVSKQPVLMMGAIKPENYRSMDFRRLAFVVYDAPTVKALAKTGRKIKIHIEIDTGMSRHGVATRDLPAFLNLVAKYPTLNVEGVMSHLANADNATDDSYNKQQASDFDDAVNQILASGFKPKYFHIAQSAGSAKIQSKFANCLRVGIALYGVNPLEPKDSAYKQLKDLTPALSFTSTITKVTNIDAGTSVSYGKTYVTKQKTRIGVIPVGYYEGLPRDLSNKGKVQYKTKYLPIAGRVCMNHTMIDLGNSDVGVGSRVTIFSRDKASKNTIEAICREYKLFNYVLLVGLNQNIRRKIVA